MKALVLALVLYCPLPLAQEPERIRCEGGYCIMIEQALRKMLTTIERLANHAQELRALCGWEGKP